LEARQVLSAAFDVVGLTALRNDPAFVEIDGRAPEGPVGVAVLDSGIFGNHQDLAGNFIAWFDAVTDGGNPQAVSGPGSTSANQTRDPNGHGTHVAGTVGATDPEIGAAPAAGLVGVRALAADGEPRPFHDTILAGLNWVLANHQRYNIRVVNMSIQNGTNHNSTVPANDWARAIDRLEQAGVTVVSATGNAYASFAALGASSPAIFSSLSIANTWEDIGAGDRLPDVGAGPAVDWCGIHNSPQPDDLAATSQRSTLPNQVAAPGSTILSTWNGQGGQLYNTISGTSMASPLVAGMVALMQDAAATFGGRYLTVTEVVDIVRSTADAIVDAQNPNTFRQRCDDQTGFTRVDLSETGATFLRVNVHRAMERVRDLVTTNEDIPDPPMDPADRTDDTNNSLASAVELPPLDATNQVRQVGRIGADGQVNVGIEDVDLFELTLAAPGNLTISLSPVVGGQEFDPVARLFDSQGAQIGIQDDAGNNVYPTLTTGRLAMGTYYIGVSSFQNVSYNVNSGGGAAGGQSAGDYELIASLGNPDPNGVVQGAVDLNLTAPDASNPNGNLVAGGVPVANFIQGVIESDPNPVDPEGPRIVVGPTDVDIFRVVAPDTGFLYVDVNARDVFGLGAIDSFVRVFSEDLSQVWENDDELPGFALDSLLEVPVVVGETYYVAVTTYDNRTFNPLDPFDRSAPGGEVGVYQLFTSFYNGDVNGTAFGAVQTQDGPAGGTIGVDFGIPLVSVPANGGFKDVDFFFYTAPQDGLLEVAVGSQDSSLVSSLALWEFSPAGDNILQIAQSDGATATLRYEIAAGQSVYFSITGQGNGGFNWFATASGTGGDTGNYEVEISRRSLADVGQFADDSINRHTPQSLVAGEVKSGEIGRDGDLVRSADDVDLFRFVPTTSGEFAFTAEGVGEEGADTFVRLFNAQGQEVAFNDDGDADTTDSLLVANLTAGQTYFLGVNGFSLSARDYDPLTGASAAEGSRGKYRLSVAATSGASDLPGDFNGNGQVEQSDLDLVLLNWGRAAIPSPDGWVSDLPDGNVDQDELDRVLLGWGDSAAATSVAFAPLQVQRLAGIEHGARALAGAASGGGDTDGDGSFARFLDLDAAFAELTR
jgi:hypothetical protein